MSFSRNVVLTKAEQDRQMVQSRYKNMQTSYSSGLTAYDKDKKARIDAAEQRRLAAIKQKVPMAHKCPASGECQECEERQQKARAAMLALSKPKTVFKKKTLNRQRSHSADDVSVVFTESSVSKATSMQYARGGRKDVEEQKGTKSITVTVKDRGTGYEDNFVTKVTSSIAEWIGIKSKPVERVAPAVPLAGTAKEAICSTPASSSSTAIVPSAPVHPREGYVKDTAAMFLQIGEAQSSSITPKGSPSMTEVIMPRTLTGVTMKHSAVNRKTATSKVTKKGTLKDTVTHRQTETKKLGFSYN